MAKYDLDDFSRFLDTFRHSLVARAMATARVDRLAVEHSMKQVYLMLGHAVPEFVWMDNPWQLSYAPAQYTFRGKQFLVAAAEDTVGRRIRGHVQEILGTDGFGEFFDALWSRLAHQRTDLGLLVFLLNRERALNETMQPNVSVWFQNSSIMDADIDSRSQQMRTLRSPRVGAVALWTQIPRSWNNDIEWCFASLLRLAIAQVSRDYFDLRLDRDDKFQLDLFLSLAESAHAYLCFEDVCFLTERPCELHMDENNRFHKVGGPAIRYDDQTQVYAWRGTRVPPYAVLTEPNLDTIESEANIEVRRVLIERYGVQNYLLDSGSEIVQHDQCGTLYMKELPWDEPIVMVRVTNSTPEPNGEYKSYFLRVPPNIRTARAAVAWTFGISEFEYHPTVES